MAQWYYGLYKTGRFSAPFIAEGKITQRAYPQFKNMFGPFPSRKQAEEWKSKSEKKPRSLADLYERGEKYSRNAPSSEHVKRYKESAAEIKSGKLNKEMRWWHGGRAFGHRESMTLQDKKRIDRGENPATATGYKCAKCGHAIYKIRGQMKCMCIKPSPVKMKNPVIRRITQKHLQGESALSHEKAFGARRALRYINETFKRMPGWRVEDVYYNPGGPGVMGEATGLIWKPGSKFGAYIQVSLESMFGNNDIMFRVIDEKHKWSGFTNMWGSTWSDSPADMAHKLKNAVSLYERSHGQNPYPHEHAARIQSPRKFIRFRRANNEFGHGIDVIYGIKRVKDKGPKGGRANVQAIRFDASMFTARKAKKWLRDHGWKELKFEPARKNNPGALWHEGRVIANEEKMKAADNKEEKIYYRGKRDEAIVSEGASLSMKRNPVPLHKSLCSFCIAKYDGQMMTGYSIKDEKCDICKRKSDLAMVKMKKNNPPSLNGAVKIYDKIESIEATKGKDSLWPGQGFRHDFKDSSEAAIYGLPDGSLLIKSKKGRRLHKNFNYPERKRKRS